MRLQLDQKVILAANKETGTVITNESDHQNKVNNIVNEGIVEGKYIETVDNNHRDLKCSQDFLHQNLNKLERRKKMHPKST